MANQNPQPEVYTTRHEFGNGAAVAAGTSVTQTIYTNQANNEEVRIYGIAVRVTDSAGASQIGDYAVSIQVGANNVPSNQFDVSWLANNIANGGGILMFPSPVLVLFQQPLSVTVTTLSAIPGTASDANNRTVVVDLIGELAIQKAPPGYRGV